MSRWEPNARERLQAAAVELFQVAGYEATTIAQIAERAGVTPRTFFNHFPDKREVLFAGRAERQRSLLVEQVSARDPGSPVLLSVLDGLRVVAEKLFDGNRDEVVSRLAVIATTPELWERELQKRAALGDALAGALRDTGLDSAEADLAARVGMLIQQTAMQNWLEADDVVPLTTHLDAALTALEALTSAAAGPAS